MMPADVAPGVRRNLPPTAHLRVFSPLRAFDDVDQALIKEQPPRSRALFEIQARQALLARISRDVTDPFPHQTLESYRVLHWQGDDGVVALYCPEQLPLRAGMAAGLLEDEIPFTLMDVVIPVTAAEAHSERLQEHGMWLDDELVHTRDATWGVPLAWFAAIREDDHEEVDDQDEVLSSVRLVAPLVLVLERLGRAAAILSRTADELPLLAQIDELREWLGGFHRGSAVELDYGPLADYVWPDDSPSDLREGLDALDEGDYLSAAAAHRRLVLRWNRVRALGRAS